MGSLTPFLAVDDADNGEEDRRSDLIVITIAGSVDYRPTNSP